MTPDHADATFKDGMTEKAFQDYLRIRTALVRGDAGEAKDAAGDLADSFGADRSNLKRSASAVAEAAELENQREAFAALSSEIEPFLREGLSKGSVHLMHCPMAFENRGATWLSDSAEVRNPYFGDRMLTCGEIRETITPKTP